MNIDEAFGQGRDNNFDIIRLLAATLVIVSHSYPIAGATEPFTKFITYGNAGSLSVSIFFAISGFLVTRSVERNDITYYIVARILRIFPGLLVALILTSFIIGPLFTVLPLREYFDNWLLGAHLRTFFLFTFNTALPGVFENNPFPTWVNGSLWSLPYEFLLYLMLPLVFVFGGLKLSSNWLLAVLALVGYYLAKSGALGLTYSSQGSPIFGAIYPYLIMEYGAFFILGSSCWVYRRLIPLSAGLFFCLFALSWAGARHPGGYIFYCILVSYGTIWAALRLPAIDISKMGDISYGVYIYAFPIQQSIVYLKGGIVSPTFITLVTIPVVYIMAYYSYWYIERPALNLKSALTHLISRAEK